MDLVCLVKWDNCVFQLASYFFLNLSQFTMTNTMLIVCFDGTYCNYKRRIIPTWLLKYELLKPSLPTVLPL